MKTKLYILLLTLSAFAIFPSLWAQDVATLSQTDITGTARFVGMAGAMTAVGGDPTSVMVNNPAGLGVYRRLETSITLDLQIDRTWQQGVQQREAANYFIPNQVSLVFHFGGGSNSRIMSHNLFIGYQRLKNYKRQYSANSTVNASVTDIMAGMANKGGVVEDDFFAPDGSFADDVWYNENIGWLPALGRAVDMIRWDAVTPGSLDSMYFGTPVSPYVKQGITVKETGFTNQYSFDYALNIDDRWYFGLGLNLISFKYSKEMVLDETYLTDNSWMVVNSYCDFSGVGVSGSFGFLGRPTRWLRLGFALHTPSAVTLKIRHGGEADSWFNNTTSYYMSTGENTFTDYDFKLPLRASAGLAFQFNDRGLLSFQYDYTNGKEGMHSRHCLRVGGECVLAEKLYLNAGYAYESEFTKKAYYNALPYNDVRTDTDFFNLCGSNTASVGFGYRGRYLIAQAAYSLRWQKLNMFPFDSEDCYNMRTRTHRVVFTFAFHL